MGTMVMCEEASEVGLGRDTPWSDRFARRALGMKSSMIRELLKLTERPEIISFAGGLPAPEVFPTDEIREACERVLTKSGAAALQYGATEGYRPLRELIVRHMARYGIDVSFECVMVTAGSQSGLDLVGKLLLNPGDHVAVEAPTYLGALQAFTAYEPSFLSVPIDDDGLQVERLPELLRRGPKFLYVLPNFQNPAGTTLSLPRRRLLVELADRFGVPIVEDDPYGQLRYEGAHLPPLVALDAELHGGARGERAFRGGVIYLGTLSKVFAPGFRLGWVVAPEPVIAKLAQLKQGADLQTATFTQMVACEVARGGFLDRHVRRIRQVYDERRLAMLESLARHFPAGARWTRPSGGLFLWVTLPPGVDSMELLDEALHAGVAFIPGAPFYADGGGADTLRLNFSYCTPERIEEGIGRLGRLLRARGL
jgi:2-aminoadipate transaminase